MADEQTKVKAGVLQTVITADMAASLKKIAVRTVDTQLSILGTTDCPETTKHELALHVMSAMMQAVAVGAVAAATNAKKVVVDLPISTGAE